MLFMDVLGKHPYYPDYYDHIKRFSKSFRDLGSNVTLKVHIVKHHLEEFMVIKGGKFGKCIFRKTTDNFLNVLIKILIFHILN